LTDKSLKIESVLNNPFFAIQVNQNSYEILTFGRFLLNN
jgi:hypothetical protein